MEVLKIKFVDFWFGFVPDNNYFFNLLSSSYRVEICDDPQILIYSCYGSSYLQYNCIKIYYTAENLRPDFSGCDFAISFDYNKDPRHYRLPLYALYMDQETSEKLVQKRSREKALEIWQRKAKFCCMVVSNGQSKKRLQFFEKLSAHKAVDSGGKIMNNVGGPVKDKMAFISDYRFVIAFENATHPGYTTEKIVEAFLADCIPLYWGDPFVTKEFDEGSFIYLDKSKTEEQLIMEVIGVDTSEEKAVNMLMRPKFADGIAPPAIDKQRVMWFFEKIIHISKDKIPVAKTWKRYIHFYRVKRKHYFNFLKGMTQRIISKLTRIKPASCDRNIQSPGIE